MVLSLEDFFGWGDQRVGVSDYVCLLTFVGLARCCGCEDVSSHCLEVDRERHLFPTSPAAPCYGRAVTLMRCWRRLASG